MKLGFIRKYLRKISIFRGKSPDVSKKKARYPLVEMFLNLFILMYICAKFGDHNTCLQDSRQGAGTNCPLPVLSNVKKLRKYRVKPKIWYLQNLVPAKITVLR